jgi:hypothetical protein
MLLVRKIVNYFKLRESSVLIVITIEPTMARRIIKLTRINQMEYVLYITEPILLMSVIGAKEASQEKRETKERSSYFSDENPELNICRIPPVFLKGIALLRT